MQSIASLRPARVLGSENSFARRALTLITGIAGAQGIGIVAMVVLARQYSPEAFGTYGVFVAFTGIGATLATLRYERAFVVRKSRSERHGLMATILSASVLAALVLLAGQRGLRYLGLIPSGWPLLLAVLAAVTVSLNGLQLAFRSLALAEGAFIVLSRLRISEAAVLAVAQVGLGAALGGVYGLVAGTVVATLFALLVLAVVAVRQGWLSPARYPWRYTRALAAARRNVHFPRYMALSSLLNAIAPQAPVLLISSMLSPALAGQFFLAQRIVKGPMTWVTSGVSDVNFQDAASRHRSELPRLYRRRTRRLVVYGAVPFAVMAMFAPIVFRFVFGQEWIHAGHVVRLLAPGLFMQWAFTPFTPLFVVIGHQRLHLHWSVMRLILVGAGVYGGTLIAGINGAAVGFGVALLISFVVQHVLLLNLLPLE